MNNPSPLESIFFAALEKGSPEERAAYLHKACAGDADLRDRVDKMLAAQTRAGSFLEQPALNPNVTVYERPVSEGPGTLIGPYKLLEQIGEGGFGVVFLAEQLKPMHRKVALKILKLGMDTRQVTARFEAERQALAIMDHPNIAKVFDGGATASGRPFFVMEMVRGLPITEFCDQNHLTARQRLELFIPVCQAVQHAHQKGIIHRDLKPSNVLVSRHDTTPVVKVIDFGVAKALGQALTDKTLFTGVAQMIGTPLYMSPEQAGMSDLDVDTRSDIYSLGVVLYELLTGTTPFTKQRFKEAAYDEIRRIIREEEPPRPSMRLSQSTESLPSISAQRQTEPANLTKLVRGELDWIVMKALEKDRNRRYETANGLAMDVQRYLVDEPVFACPPSASYRLRKFIRRNRAGLAAAGLILFFVLLLGAGAGWLSRNRAVRRQVVEEAAGRALQEADDLQKRDKWQEALAAAERAQAALASGEAGAQLQDQIQERLADLQMIQQLEELRIEWADHLDSERLDRALARLFAQLGIVAESLSPAEIAAQVRRQPTTAVRIAAALDNWAQARRDWLIGHKGDPETWKRLLEAARLADPDPWRGHLRQLMVQEDLNALRQLAESADIGTLPVQSLDLMGTALVLGGDRQACVAWLRKAQRQYPGDATINFALAFHLSNLPSRPWDDILRFYQAALAARPQSPRLHQELAWTLLRAGRPDEARATLYRAIKLKPDLAGDVGALNITSRLAVNYAAHSRSADALQLIDELPAQADRQGSSLQTDYTIALCVQNFRRLRDPEACRAATAMLEKKNPADAGSLYNAACCRALTAAAQDQAKGPDAARLEKEEADLAMAWLTKAVAAGFADPAQLRQDADLDTLRTREDFRKLLADVEAKAPPRTLARSYILLSQWDKAAAEYAKADLLARPLRDEAFACACLFLIRGDSEGYNGFFQGMIQRAAQMEDPSEAYVLARSCAIARESPVDPARAVQWANQTGARAHNPWDLHTLGLAQYRAGQFDQALRSFTEANVKEWRYSDLNWFGLALVHHRLGHADEARLCFDKGIQWQEREGPPGPERPAKLLPQDWLEAQLLRSEAENMLKIKRSP
ncbi:MAG: protein kinase domain-containing protein [Gemmataceae bacterium]